MTAAWPIATPIETARLRLEPLEPAHAEEMVAVLAAPELYAFTGGIGRARQPG